MLFQTFSGAVLLALAATPTLAQTANPRIVEFLPSADHNVTLADGRPAVTRYDFEVYAAGASAPFQTVTMGKPAPQSDGFIRYDFSSTIAGWPLPGGTYESRVAAVGPNGTSRSSPSNQFTLSVGGCAFSISPTSVSLGNAGGATTVSVMTTAGCSWSATSGASWITPSPSSGSGPGAVTLTYAANGTTAARTATLSIAGRQVTATQAAGTGVINVTTETEFQAAVLSAASNSTILIAPGTYRLTKPLRISGASNVTLRGSTGKRDDVVLLGPGMAQASGAVNGVWTDTANLTIADLTLGGFYDSAIVFAAAAHAPRVSNVRLVDSGQFLRAESDSVGGVDGGVVEWSLFEFTTTGRDASTRGIELQRASGWVIRDNVFRNVRGPEGAQSWPTVLAWNGSSNTIVERNGLVNCQFGIALGAVQRTPDDHTGGIIRNNIVYRTWGESLGGFGISVADSPYTKVLHNTVVLSGTYGASIELRWSDTAGVVLANNLTDAATWWRDGASGNEYANYASAIPGMFVNAAAGDLHLVGGATAAIDRGVPLQDVTDDWDRQTRPVGAGPDIGADEVQAVVTITTITTYGRITEQGTGAAVGGVTLTLSGAASASTVTTASGDYSFAGLTPGASYLVTPAKSGYTFTPASRTITPTANTQADFVAVSTIIGGGSGGTGDGLRGEYFDNMDFTAPVGSRVDATVNFDWTAGAPQAGMGADTFSVRWTGRVQARFSETYTFYTVSDDGVRLWVNGQLLVDNWTDHSEREDGGSIMLAAGQWYDVRMEFYENGGYATAKLLWSSASTPKAAIPQGQLSSGGTTSGSSGDGLRGEYFDNIDLTGSVGSRVDASVNFAWGVGAPQAGMGADTFSVRWTGKVQAQFTETYTFYTLSDDGVRLWVNGQLLIDKWTDHSEQEDAGSITLTAGQWYDVRMEFYENGGYATAKLLWSSASTAKAVIPQARLSSGATSSGGTSGLGDGLRGEYYDNANLTGLVGSRVDSAVNFSWGLDAPMAGVQADTFSVRWTGRVQAKFSETYTFYTVSDDGVRLWVNGQLLVDKWTDHSEQEDSGTIALAAGQWYDVRMEFYENSVYATARLLWSSPSTPKAVIPQAQLSSR